MEIINLTNSGAGGSGNEKTDHGTYKLIRASQFFLNREKEREIPDVTTSLTVYRILRSGSGVQNKDYLTRKIQGEAVNGRHKTGRSRRSRHLPLE